MKKGILVVGDYNRATFAYIGGLISNSKIVYFLEYYSAKEITNDFYKKFGNEIFWKDYKNAYRLLDSLNIEKVIFFFIESFNHVALNTACKVRSIPTVHVEHGIRNSEIAKQVIKEGCKRNVGLGKRSMEQLEKLTSLSISDLRAKILTRQFYFNTIRTSPLEQKRFLKEFYKIRKNNTISDTFKKIRSPLRIADSYISFSPNVFNFHRDCDHLSDNYPVVFTGIPESDKFAGIKPKKNLTNAIIYIDQSFPEQKLFGWTQSFRANLIDQINSSLLIPEKRLMYVKTHPGSDQKIWRAIEKKYKMINLIDDNQLLDAVSESQMVIGFGSTLLISIAAIPHIRAFALEIHPDTKIKYASLLFSETDCINTVYSINELTTKLHQAYNGTEGKEKFIEKWLYKFDGQSSLRLKAALNQ